MKIAFLNLCHCDPDLVARAAGKLGKNENFHMYIHVDQKTSEATVPGKNQRSAKCLLCPESEKSLLGRLSRH